MTAKPMGREWARFALLTVAFIVFALASERLLVLADVRQPPEDWHLLGPDLFSCLLGYYEPIGQAIFAAAMAIFVVLQFAAWRSPPAQPTFKGLHAVATALLVFLLCYLGTSAVFHRFPMTLDEYDAFFQARIFASGHVITKLPEQLVPLSNAVVPDYLEILPNGGVIESYLPVYSAITALVTLVFGTPWLVNPLMAAGSVLFIYGVGCHLAISRGFAGWAVLLLVSSSQFLLDGMSGYAMSSHLFFSLAWLYFYTHPDRRFYYVCPPLGVLAIGLHQPFCHIFFVLPFLLRLVLDRRWREAVYSAIVYGAGGLGWIAWIHFMRPDNLALANVSAAPDSRMALVWYFNFLNFIAWQNVLTVVLLLGALGRVRSLPPFFRDLALSFVITVGFYCFHHDSQGAGWGYRYLHQVLGNVALLAAWAAVQFRVSRISLAALVFIALAVQLPYRCHEVRQVVGRQAEAYDKIAHLDADYVIIDRWRGLLSVEVVRNDPTFTNRPLMLYRSRMTDEQFATLMRDPKTVFVSIADYRKLGVPLLPGLPPDAPPAALPKP